MRGNVCAYLAVPRLIEVLAMIIIASNTILMTLVFRLGKRDNPKET